MVTSDKKRHHGLAGAKDSEMSMGWRVVTSRECFAVAMGALTVGGESGFLCRWAGLTMRYSRVGGADSAEMGRTFGQVDPAACSAETGRSMILGDVALGE